MAAGAPEDLVLRGVFAAVSSSEGVGFDEEAGSFAMNRTFNGDMALTGEGNLEYPEREIHLESRATFPRIKSASAVHTNGLGISLR